MISATAEGKLHYKWTVEESQLNRNGKLHGGVIASMWYFSFLILFDAQSDPVLA